MEEKVLIVGAGPTGLILALSLTQFGIPVRIIDKNSEPGQTSRAMAVHARTLEFYQQLGFADEVVNKGIVINHLKLRKNKSVFATIDIGSVGKHISPFPFILSFPQDDHERLLIALLAKQGIHVERNTELTEFTQDNEGVTAKLRKDNQLETISTPFLFACDGARSTVRTQLGMNFAGGTYSQIYYVADVIAAGEIVTDAIQICLRDNGFALAFPIRSSGSIRLIGIVPKDQEKKSNLSFADIEAAALENMQITVSSVNWFSTYHSHHRVAEHFRNNRIFLLGDAGHIHSPVGGQGMNTGIGDAFNLAWKIAAVMQDRADPSILESYEVERMNFANQLVNTTDRLFQAITNEGMLGKFIRSIFFPYVLPFFTRFQFVRNLQFRTVSQIQINYRNSPISTGRSGKISAGDRLPWVSDHCVDNYHSFTALDWQIHVYGKLSDQLKDFMHQINFKYHEFPWQQSFNNYSLKENAIYLIRPDGYIAYIDPTQNESKLKEYLTKYKIVPRK